MANGKITIEVDLKDKDVKQNLKECKGYSFSLKIQSMFCPNKIAKKKK